MVMEDNDDKDVDEDNDVTLIEPVSPQGRTSPLTT